jgi:hypothetical protein
MNTSTLRVGTLFCFTLATGAHAQELYVNAGGTPSNPAIGTGALSRNGTIAPANTEWSELASEFGASNMLAGLAAHSLLADEEYRLSDDFIVPPGDGWLITGLRFFAYEPEATHATSPVAAISLRIWDGPPGSTGANIVFGEGASTLQATSTATPFLRIFSSDTLPAPMTPGSARPVWQLDAATTIRLNPGTYWLDWGYVLSTPACTAFSPTATIPGTRELDGSNAMQLDPDLGWITPADPGRPAGASDSLLELPFVLLGVPACPADVDNSGGVDGDDVIIFFALWDQNLMDFNGDGGTDGDDIIAFFARWDSGC